MAYKAVVSAKARESIKNLLKRVANEKGAFNLAMLVQTLPEVPDRWTLVVSAPWADSLGSKSVISYLSSRLSEDLDLDRNALSAIDRISVKQSNDPVVQAILQRLNDFLGVDVSTVEGGFQLRNSVVEGWSIPEGFIFVADPNANGKSARSAHRTKVVH